MTASGSADLLRHVRYDQTGGLRCPDWLARQFAEYRRERVSADEVHRSQERAIAEAIRQQEELDLPIVSDGEFRRLGGSEESFGGAAVGFDAVPYKSTRAEPAGIPSEASADAPIRVESGPSGPGRAIVHRLPVKERLSFRRNVILKEYSSAASLTTTPVKVSLVGPDLIAQRFAYENSRDVYDGVDEFLSDVIAIERKLIEEVVAAGCRYVQIDEPGYTAYVDPIMTKAMRARGEDPEKNLARAIRADNELIAGIPGVTFGVHICRGRDGGRGGRVFNREGHYDAIAEQLFSEADFDRFLLEYDGDHAGGFEPLRFMPRNKLAILGLVSNHGPVEDPAYLIKRLDEASRHIDLDRAGLSPRCGFDGTSDEAAQWAKLGVIQSVISEVW